MARLQVATALAIASLRVSLGAGPIDDRVASLLANMTVEEKVAQLFYGGQPSSNISELFTLMPHGIGALSIQSLAERNAIQAAFMGSTRLGIPVSFYGETLRSGGTANVTIFPMPALLGCSWNTSLAEAMGRVVATEAWSNGVDRSFSPVIQGVCSGGACPSQPRPTPSLPRLSARRSDDGSPLGPRPRELWRVRASRRTHGRCRDARAARARRRRRAVHVPPLELLPHRDRQARHRVRRFERGRLRRRRLHAPPARRVPEAVARVCGRGRARPHGVPPRAQRRAHARQRRGAECDAAQLARARRSRVWVRQ